jgi:hypothetical protein
VIFIRRLFAVVILVLLFGILGFLVCHDFTAHSDSTGPFFEEVFHYSIHIVICLVFCTIFHNPAHRFAEWLKSMLGLKTHPGHEDGNCH